MKPPIGVRLIWWREEIPINFRVVFCKEENLIFHRVDDAKDFFVVVVVVV